MRPCLSVRRLRDKDQVDVPSVPGENRQQICGIHIVNSICATLRNQKEIIMYVQVIVM